MDNFDKNLAPTRFLDWDREPVLSSVRDITAGIDGAPEKAAALFLFVRDAIRYNPYVNFLDERVYVSSTVIGAPSTFCVPKALLLASMARAAGIPSRIRFADIRNRLMPDKMKDLLKSDIIYGHGFAELNIGGRWIKATPAYDRALCETHGFALTGFNGRDDAIFPESDLAGRPHIEYLGYSEPFDDFPFEWLTAYYLEKYEMFRKVEPMLRKEIEQKA